MHFVGWKGQPTRLISHVTKQVSGNCYVANKSLPFPCRSEGPVRNRLRVSQAQPEGGVLGSGYRTPRGGCPPAGAGQLLATGSHNTFALVERAHGRSSPSSFVLCSCSSAMLWACLCGRISIFPSQRNRSTGQPLA